MVLKVSVDKPAIEGGNPIRNSFLPYTKHYLTHIDIAKVAQALKSDWITGGRLVTKFEERFAGYIDCRYAVSMSSGTAALHSALAVLDHKNKSEIITTPFTHVSTINAILLAGCKPVFVDVDPETGNIDVEQIEKSISNRTKAILPIHFAGLPCQIKEIGKIAINHNLLVVEDACHALGAEYHGKKIGSISDLSVFSLHASKGVTTGEGGMIATNNKLFAEKLKRFRYYGLDTDAKQRYGSKNSPCYQAISFGCNYRLTDFQCALGISQLEKVNFFIEKREKIARFYSESLKEIEEIQIPTQYNGSKPSWHLYTVRLNTKKLKVDRDYFLKALRSENIGANLHFVPIYLHPYHKKRLRIDPGDFPNTNLLSNQIITLPLFSQMTKNDALDVVAATEKLIKYYRR